ncbi:MAG: bifunctional precorrin-2 dehydrogenase/sirohydrochlorin ferrochelatase, partial [Gammaproteobacteria bacterium]
MDYLPVFLDLRARGVLLVGGGKVALRKSELLAEAGARIDVCAPEVLPDLASRAVASGGVVRHEVFHPGVIADHALVFVATGVPEVDRAVHGAARSRGIPVNVADVPGLCDFILPAIVDRSPLIAAFSTGGKAPVLARWLRERLETSMPAAIGRVAAFLGARRDRIREGVPDPVQRLRVWEGLVDGPVSERVLAGDEAGADVLLQDFSGLSLWLL